MRFADAYIPVRSPPTAATGFCCSLDLSPLLAAFLAIPHLHTCIFKVFSIPRGEYDIVQGVVQCPTQRPYPSLVGLRNGSGGDSSMYVHYTDTACTLLMLVAQLTVHVRRILAVWHLGPSPPCRLPQSGGRKEEEVLLYTRVLFFDILHSSFEMPEVKPFVGISSSLSHSK